MKKKAPAALRLKWKFGIFGLAFVLFLAILRVLMLLSPFDFFVDDSALSEPPSFSPKIAFLFLARNRLPLDIVWKKFFEGVADHDYNVYIHARPGFVYNQETTECPYFINRQLQNSVLVEWGEASMIEAERLLLRKALQDPNNMRFVLLSDSCIPLYNFSYIYTYLMSSEKSFLDSFTDPKENRYNRGMSPVIRKEDWRKGSQWFALTRDHVEIIATDQSIFHTFQKYCKRVVLERDASRESVDKHGKSKHDCIPDEHYVQTLLAIRGLEHQLERRTLTYTLWKEPKPGRKTERWHPYTFGSLDFASSTIKEIKAINKINYETEGRTEWCSVKGLPTPCYLFARKFTKASAIQLLNQSSGTSWGDGK